jgi:hypothetical protein
MVVFRTIDTHCLWGLTLGFIVGISASSWTGSTYCDSESTRTALPPSVLLHESS